MLSSQGIQPATQTASAAASTPPSGSTRPLAAPAQKLRARLAPACRTGRLMAAPSGRFCSPMPRLSAATPAIASGLPPAASAAASPTTMPSGRLCRVTASTTRPLCPRPPASSSPAACSSAISPTAPSTRPSAGASQLCPAPIRPARSMAGSSRLQTLAASITPAAKPIMARRAGSFGSPRSKNTTAAPSAVHPHGKAVAVRANRISCMVRPLPSFDRLGRGRGLCGRTAPRPASPHCMAGRAGMFRRGAAGRGAPRAGFCFFRCTPQVGSCQICAGHGILNLIRVLFRFFRPSNASTERYLEG